MTDSRPGPSDPTAIVDVRQVIARNIRRARRVRGLTQQQMADKLNTLTGGAWTNVSVSQAEGAWSAKPARVRQIDLNELVAFALVLEVPVPLLFTPPAELPDSSGAPGSSTAWISLRYGDAGHCVSPDELSGITGNNRDDSRQSKWPPSADWPIVLYFGGSGERPAGCQAPLGSHREAEIFMESVTALADEYRTQDLETR